jgi:hypothetical protein
MGVFLIYDIDTIWRVICYRVLQLMEYTPKIQTLGYYIPQKQNFTNNFRYSR